MARTVRRKSNQTEVKHNFNSVSSTGKAKRSFETGSVRDSREGKGRYDLLSPIATHRLAKHFENGSREYSARNWEKGQPLCGYIDSAMRHINKLLSGMTDEDHAAAAMWNIGCFIHTQTLVALGKLPAELDDLPKVNYTEVFK